MPDLLPHAGATTYPGPPSQPGAPARLAEFRAELGRNVRVADLWLPEEWARFQRWMRAARRGAHQPSAYFPQSSLAPLARGFVWDSRDPDNCVPMEPSDERTVFPGKRQIDRAAFRRIAREVGSRDGDIIGQVGGGGVESRSRCELTTELHSHAPGLCARPDAAEKAVAAELAEQWALGPFYHPPTVPIRALPRDVIQQQRSRVLDSGEVEDFLKDRITLNPSRGPDSVNAGIPKEERAVALTTARDLGFGLALIDVPARDAGLTVAGYGVDMTSAYSFLQVQRLDWWQFAYLWFDADGTPHFRLLVRVGFGGAMSPRRFQSVSVIITTLARAWQREFDQRHPPPRAIRQWEQARRQLQREGALPPGADHATPAVAGVYIDDLAGGCCDDDVPMPTECHGVRTADVDLGELAAFALGGKPLRRNSRPAVHCVTAIAAIRAFGLEETPGKTEGGDVFVNLGLRLRLRDGFIDCPPPKRRILLRDLGEWHAAVQRLEPFDRQVAEKQVGRLGNLTQVMPELLTHISAGYRAANAGYVDRGVRRLNAKVPMARGSPMHDGLSKLLPHAIDLLERNEGVPLAPRARFAAPDDPGVLLVVSDASGHDGCGGWAHLGTADRAPVVVSEHWPDWAREALRQFKLPAAERTPRRAAPLDASRRALHHLGGGGGGGGSEAVHGGDRGGRLRPRRRRARRGIERHASDGRAPRVRTRARQAVAGRLGAARVERGRGQAEPPGAPERRARGRAPRRPRPIARPHTRALLARAPPRDNTRRDDLTRRARVPEAPLLTAPPPAPRPTRAVTLASVHPGAKTEPVATAPLRPPRSAMDCGLSVPPWLPAHLELRPSSPPPAGIGQRHRPRYPAWGRGAPRRWRPDRPGAWRPRHLAVLYPSRGPCPRRSPHPPTNHRPPPPRPHQPCRCPTDGAAPPPRRSAPTTPAARATRA